MFLKFVNSSAKVKNASLLFDLLESVVLVRMENVVQIVTEHVSMCNG